jgi:1-acylglycerone phosphate reductase
MDFMLGVPIEEDSYLSPVIMSKKTVLITGASAGGIGDALAQEFHSRGLRVFATARSLERIQHLEEMGMEVWILDVTSKESINETAARVRELTGGSLDFLVNNAGVGQSLVTLSCSCCGTC